MKRSQKSKRRRMEKMGEGCYGNGREAKAVGILRRRKCRASSTLTLLRPSVPLSLKFSNPSIAVAAPPLWNKLPPALRQISESSYELTQTSPLKISPRLFHSKLKT